MTPMLYISAVVQSWNRFVQRFRQDPDEAILKEKEAIEKIEAMLLALPQIELLVVHHFSSGVYVREMFAPKGILVIGHEHREECLNIMLSGRATIWVNGETKELTAPCVLPSRARGRKMAIVHEPMRWLTIHPAITQNVEKLERRLFIKSPAWLKYHTAHAPLDEQEKALANAQAFLRCLMNAKDVVLKHRLEAPAGFDPQNSGVAIAIGTVVAAGASAYSAYAQSQSAEEAQSRARQDAKLQRELEYLQFREGRGGGGYSIYPYYGQRDGAPIEPQLFQDALRVYDATGALTPQQRMAQYQSDLEAFGPMQGQALAQAGGIFTGETERAELAAQAPVFAARTGLARARGAGVLEKAAEDANAALAIQSGRRGFTGTSSFEQRPILDIRRRGLQEQATELGQANLLNAQQEAQTRLSAINRQLQNVNLPFQLARQQAEFRQLPEQQLIEAQNRRMGVFQPFNIGPAAFFRPSPLPVPQPNVSTGQIVGQALGTLGTTATNYFLTQDLINRQQQNNQQQVYNQPRGVDQWFLEGS